MFNDGKRQIFFVVATSPPGLDSEGHELVPGLGKVEYHLGEKHPGLVTRLEHVDVVGPGQEDVGVSHHDDVIILHLGPGCQQISQGSELTEKYTWSRGGTD